MGGNSTTLVNDESNVCCIALISMQAALPSQPIPMLHTYNTKYTVDVTVTTCRPVIHASHLPDHDLLATFLLAIWVKVRLQHAGGWRWAGGGCMQTYWGLCEQCGALDRLPPCHTAGSVGLRPPATFVLHARAQRP